MLVLVIQLFSARLSQAFGCLCRCFAVLVQIGRFTVVNLLEVAGAFWPKVIRTRDHPQPSPSLTFWNAVVRRNQMPKPEQHTDLPTLLNGQRIAHVCG